MHNLDFEQWGRILILCAFVSVLIYSIFSTGILQDQLKSLEGIIHVKVGGVEYGNGEFQLCNGKECVNIIQRIDSVITEMNHFEIFLIILSIAIVAFEVIIVFRRRNLSLE